MGGEERSSARCEGRVFNRRTVSAMRENAARASDREHAVTYGQ